MFSHSTFDVGRSMFDVRRSAFKTIPYGINVTCERLQNNLALMGLRSNRPLPGRGRIGPQAKCSFQERYNMTAPDNMMLAPRSLSLICASLNIKPPYRTLKTRLVLLTAIM